VGSYYWLWYASRVHDLICSGIGKLISFAADESADNYVGSTAGSSNCISTIANRSNQYVGFWAGISSAESGFDDTTQVSYRGPRV